MGYFQGSRRLGRLFSAAKGFIPLLQSRATPPRVRFFCLRTTTQETTRYLEGNNVPRIFDNIEQQLLPALKNSMAHADHADFCVGYFNLRGWRRLDERIDTWAGGPGNCCRLLVGMQKAPEQEVRAAFSVTGDFDIDNQMAARLRRALAEEFREQLTLGTQSNDDEAGLRRLAKQIREKKVIVKLHLRHALHAKLYLLFRPGDHDNPRTGYVGSSNLTFAGLSQQGELNVDVLDHDACEKLAAWFEDRWNDRFCIDISDDLAAIIEESWAREALVPPYHIYINMAYHLSQEARSGLTEFRIPSDFGNKLFDFQVAAVKIAAHHLNKRNGVLIGDVVGLGKTLMATALARIFEDDYGYETLILCPRNLTSMWEWYQQEYKVHALVVPTSMATKRLPDLRRYRLVLIDESHNLRNRESRAYSAIRDYIQANGSKVILLSATPYNKSYLDLSSQLRLFVDGDADIGARPERKINEVGELEFIRDHQCGLRTLAAFEKSQHPDDWRELMRLFLVRRTRGFIKQHYATTDETNNRKYLTFPDGTRSYFPDREPKTVKFTIDDTDPTDQYARLYTADVVDAVNALFLPRYGLGNYIANTKTIAPTADEKKTIEHLGRAGKRLMGFCRTNLFKRLESSGQAFVQSVERHILRNYIVLHAIDHGLPVPIGTQDMGLLDAPNSDDDIESGNRSAALFDNDAAVAPVESSGLKSEADFRKRAAEVYLLYTGQYKKRFTWLRAALFMDTLGRDLANDAKALLGVLDRAGPWNPARDTKLAGLHALLTGKHRHDKVIVFTQFADTVQYLESQLKARGLQSLAGVTGQSEEPTEFARRFSPCSNGREGKLRPDQELRVLVATDVLSEGQNLQDCVVIVNYDLPWAIIRLIQRAGRVDRIGQQSAKILCYTFLPTEGVEKIIHLRERVRHRLKENGEVIGADESFFEDDGTSGNLMIDLYNEKSGLLDGEDDTEVDLTSYAYQIWKNATGADPTLLKTIPALPPVEYGTKAHQKSPTQPDGVLVYIKTGEGNDALAWINRDGISVTESQFSILKAAECTVDTPALPRHEQHHELVAKGMEHIASEETQGEGRFGGQLGRPSGARFRVYERLTDYAKQQKGTLFESADLTRAIDEIYRYTLLQTATDTLNRILKSGVSNQQLAERVLSLRDDSRLCRIDDDAAIPEPRIVCSLGLV